MSIDITSVYVKPRRIILIKQNEIERLVNSLLPSLLYENYGEKKCRSSSF